MTRDSDGESRPDDQTPAVMRSPRTWWKTSRRIMFAVLLVCLPGWLIFGQIAGWMARRYLSQGRLSRAENLIPWCQRLCPWESSWDGVAARIARRLGDRDSWQTVVGNWEAKAPSSTELKVERELMRIQSGSLAADSQAQLKRLILSGADSSDIAEAFILGYIAHEQLEQAQVTLAWWDGLQLRPCDAKLYRAVLSRMRGELGVAREEYNSVLLDCPRHELARIHLADLFLDFGSHDIALQHYRTVLRDAPLSVGARVGAARCLRQIGNWTGAEGLLKTLLNRPHPAYEVTRESGQIALEKGDYTLAETCLVTAHNSAFTAHQNRVASATTMALLGNSEQARMLLQQDARVESLRKRRSDLQVTSVLEPENGSVRLQLERIAEEQRQIGP